MTQISLISEALTRPESLRFPSNEEIAGQLKDLIPSLKHEERDGAVFYFINDGPSNTRIKVYPTGHMVFYTAQGNRFLCTDPEGHPLHECEWGPDEKSGKIKLKQMRMQLDSKQWVGIRPHDKTFSSEIDVKGQPGWENLTLDDLRKQAAETWQVPFSEVKYFYKDENFVSKGDGKYEIHLNKDAYYVLIDGSFDKTIFISYMCALNWEELDLIPVVELFQSTLPGTGGAAFEFLWGVFEDQSREQTLPPLRYRGLPTYPAEGAFHLFCAFFTPTGPAGEDILKVFTNTDRSHEITWAPKPNPPWRYFSDEHSISLTVQDEFLYKVIVFDDPAALPYVNTSRGGRASCEHELEVKGDKIILSYGLNKKEIPLSPKWNVKPQEEPPQERPSYPFHWDKFFNGAPPEVDPVKALFTVPFYPRGAEEIEESAVQPMALDQIFYYMENDSTMEERLANAEHILIHTFDMVIAGCIDCTKKRKYTVLFSDPEFAQKNAQLLWDFAASRDQLENVSEVSFLPEVENVDEAYQEKYDVIFKWIPFLYHTDKETCQKILESLANALKPGGTLFLLGPRPLQGMFDHFGLKAINSDPVVDMPFFRQHLKMCPENVLNPDITVFFAEKNKE